MRTSKRKFEGQLIIDHRESPGITPEQACGAGPVVGKGELWVSATYTCVHCQRIVVMNPLRTRPRHYCQKCDDYQCDDCANFECVPFAKVVDLALEAGAKGVPVILPGRFGA